VVAGRVSAFADPEIIDLATKKFVPVCTDDWYTRRRQDAEGEFFRAMASQGPRKGEGGATRQGIYAFTADGELLTFGNNGGSVKNTLNDLRQALTKFQGLPGARTRPGGVEVPDRGKPDPNYARTPPTGGLIVRVHTRILEEKKDAVEHLFAKGTCSTKGGDMASRDFLWLTKDEVRSLGPGSRSAGESYAVPEKVAERIARFHLVDNTRGEPDFWKKAEVRSRSFTLTVEKVMADGVELRLDGEAKMATDADPSKAARGYEVKLHGKFRWVPAKETFDRFDVAAVGEHWGRGTFTTGERPGRALLGVAFGLPTGNKPGDKVPPQGAREEQRYFGRD
jgi:hypothetical protein